MVTKESYKRSKKDIKNNEMHVQYNIRIQRRGVMYFYDYPNNDNTIINMKEEITIL